MSIDKLISSLDKKERDSSKIRASCQEILKDYLGVAEAYVQLAQKMQADPEKVEYLCEIVKQVMANTLGVNGMLKNVDEMLANPDELDMLVGQVLKGEQFIESLIEKFEE